MLEYLNNLDVALFRLVNRSFQNPVFDLFMPFVTDLNRQRIVVVIVVLLLGAQLWKGGKQGRIAVVALIAGIAFSDQLNSSIAKFILERPRPCHVLQGIHLLVSCGSGYSFPSSHAVNNFCGAVVLSHFSEKATPWVFSLALIVSFSRVYVGVHYPSDVLGGAIVGTFCGVFVIAVVAWCQRLLAARMK